MEPFTKELTIIDFLGILLPGICMVLLWSGEIPIHVLWESYFGYECSELTKTVFLVVSGYVVGSLVHQLAGIMEKIFWQAAECSEWLSEKNPAQRALKEVMGATEENNAASTMDVILTEVMGKRSYQKRRLFEGFHVMMRNLFLVYVTTLLWCIICRPFQIYQEIWNAVQLHLGWKIAFLLLAAVLMLLRSYQYDYLYCKYAVEDYYYLRKEEKSQETTSLLFGCHGTAVEQEGKVP